MAKKITAFICIWFCIFTWSTCARNGNTSKRNPTLDFVKEITADSIISDVELKWLAREIDELLSFKGAQKEAEAKIDVVFARIKNFDVPKKERIAIASKVYEKLSKKLDDSLLGHLRDEELNILLALAEVRD